MNQSRLKLELDNAEILLNKKDYKNVDDILRSIKVLLKRNDDPRLTLRYTKLHHRYEIELQTIHEEKYTTTKSQTDISMQSGLDKLIYARKQLYDTEGIAVSTLTELQEQRKSLESAKSNMISSNEELSMSKKIVNKLSAWWRG